MGEHKRPPGDQDSHDPKCEEGRACPTPDAHRRLNAAHRLWHQAQNLYGDPDGFETNLNACIEALRSITWVLQKAKRNIPDFESWYAGWQARMKADATMTWLKNARNHIEKRGDLDLYSTVQVQVWTSYDEAPIRTLRVDPLLSTEEIAQRVDTGDIPPDVRKDAMLVVERRWVAKDLPENELLDALAHGYGFLSEVINDAHVHLGLPRTEARQRMPDGSMVPVAMPRESLRGRMPCMLDADSYRTVHIKLGTGELSVMRTTRLPSPPVDQLEEIGQRYGGLPDMPPSGGQRSLRAEVTFWMEYAKKVLQRDGYHIQIALLIRTNESVELVRLESEDRAEKLLNFRELAREVERVGADVVIVIGESWLAPFDPGFPDRPPAESPDRIEVLTVDGINSSDEQESISVRFDRENGQIKFEGLADLEIRRSNYLDPVRRVWGIATRKTSDSDDSH